MQNTGTITICGIDVEKVVAVIRILIVLALGGVAAWMVV